MAQPSYIQKTLRMTPEVNKIFDDLEAWLDYCRFNLIDFNPKDLYKSREYKDFARYSSGYERKPRGEYNRSGNYNRQGQSRNYTR
jgi:hypothetical protein